MESEKCFICNRELTLSGEDAVKVLRGMKGLITASLERNDGKAETIQSKECVVVHESCRKNYTRKSSIAKDKKIHDKENIAGTSKLTLRSSVPVFNCKDLCLFCGKGIIPEEGQIKKESKYRRKVHEVRTLEFEKSVKNQCQERYDEWSRQVASRVDSAKDLIAAEARYHSDCHLLFFSNSISGSGSGRHEDSKKMETFKKLTEFIENNEECQFSLDELQAYAESTSTACYSRYYLKNKLKAYYGPAIVITDIPGRSSVINFKGSVDKLLQDSWYTNKMKSASDERLRIVETAAKIIKEDIRKKMYDCKNYPPPDQSTLTADNALPESLKLFLDVVTSNRSAKSENLSKKQAAIGQALISVCRPRSFIPPILLALGVYVHRRFASKQLIQLLSSLGFSVNIFEVRKYEYSVLEVEQPKQNAEQQYCQFCFDNADFNIRTLDGRNTFHCMGGIKCTTPASNIEACPIPRTQNVPKAEQIAAKGKFEISWYKKPTSSGLKDIQIKHVKVENHEQFFKATLVDTLWLCGRWAGIQSPPSWNGYMKASVSGSCDVTDIEALPFINLQPSNPSTIYSALQYASKECLKQRQKSCFVTFDQPLYAKAVEIVASDNTGELENVIIRLGGFHLLMSFLGSIGYIMAGSGIEELWEEIYAKSSVPHMLSGHAYSRSLRAHFITQQAIGTMLLEQLPNELASQKVEIQHLFLKFQEHAVSVDDMLLSSILKNVQKSLEDLIATLSKKSRTAKLWLEYYQQVCLVRMFIRAERTGDWQLHLHCVKKMLPLFHASGHLQYAKFAHLYVQQMEKLPNRMSAEEFSKFVEKGYFTIRRGHEFWSGTWSDMVIEQTLMRAMKVKGGLTQGRGLTDSVLAQWILSGPGCLKLCETLEMVAGVISSSSEQHVELRDSRRSRDDRDVQRVTDWLELHSPFQVSFELQSLATGVIGDHSINCDQASTVGENILQNIVGGNFGDLKLKRSLKVKSLANVNMSVKVRDDVVAVNPMQLFMRIVCVMDTEHDLKSVLKYELAPKPPSLFDDISLRKNVKSSLTTVFSSSEATSEKLNEETKVVLDGGYLLHALVWTRPATFGQISKSYISFVQNKFTSSATIVFDGYEGMTTKSEERRRRAGGKTSPNVVVEPDNMITSQQYDFLKNDHNKNSLIRLLINDFQAAGYNATQCTGDADSTIAALALEYDKGEQDVIVVANDTDVLVILLARAREDTNIKVLHPPSAKIPGKIFNIAKLNKEFSAMKSVVLFCHAFTGCDTTSAFFAKGKKQAWKKLLNSIHLRNVVKIFSSSSAEKHLIVTAGEKFALALYDNCGCETLDALRVLKYSRKIATQPVTASFQLASLPPTSAACEQHSLRVYLQVQEWSGNSLDPEGWRWKIMGNTLMPITTNLPPAPDHLLNLVACNCKKTCGNKCECVRSGLKCSLMCGQCHGSCANVNIDGEEDDDDHDDVL